MAEAVRLVAGLGTEYLSATAHTGKKFSMLQMNNDTVFSALVTTKVDNGNNSSTAYETTTEDYLTDQGLTGVTLSKTIIIAAPNGRYFSGITITSGDVIGIISE